MRILTLNLKNEYWEAIKDGSKDEEYRLITPYWEKRLQNREYDLIRICKGYPSHDNERRILMRKWIGVRKVRIYHPHFGKKPVRVFAINVSKPA